MRVPKDLASMRDIEFNLWQRKVYGEYSICNDHALRGYKAGFKKCYELMSNGVSRIEPESISHIEEMVEKHGSENVSIEPDGSLKVNGLIE